MHDWNAIVTAREGYWRKARQAVRRFGPVDETGFYNVLVTKVDHPRDLPGQLEALSQADPRIGDAIAHVSPAEQSFDFGSPEEFRARARDAVLTLVPRLAGRTFYVRMHRRGWKGRLVSADEERALADAIIEATRGAGDPARVTFDDPDAVVLVDTISDRGGVTLLSRAERTDHRLLPEC